MAQSKTIPLPLVPTGEVSVHPYPTDTSSQTPAVQCILSKLCPFVKMDVTLQTPYAQFSFIILISNYLGQFPTLASAVILVPADTLCSLPLLSPPSIQTTEISSNPEENWDSGGEIQPACGCPGGLVKDDTDAQGGGAAGRVWLGGQELRVSRKWGLGF